MIAKLRTRDVDRAAYINFIRKADECFHAAGKSLQDEEWNAAVINVVHCAISACDAMCVYFLGKRSAGDDHNQAVVLFKGIRGTEEFTKNAGRIAGILRLKNMAEYEERLVYKKEAEKAFKDCERLLDFVKGAVS